MLRTVGLLLQVLYVYVFGALLKTGDPWMQEASAVYYAMHLDTFATDLAIWFRQFYPVLQILTIFVFWIELFAPGLLFFPDRRMYVRTITVALLMMMHIGFRIFLNIGHFWMASLSSLMAYVPGQVWDFIARRYWTPEQRAIEIYYDRDCGFCLRTSLILREFFLPHSVPIRPAQDDPEIGPILEREVSWVVLDGQGNQYLHWDAFIFVTRQSWLLMPVGWLVRLWGMIGLGRVTYDLIGRNRMLLSRSTGFLTSGSATVVELGSFTRLMLAAVIAYCFVWNVEMTWGKSIPKVLGDTGLRHAGMFAGMNQRWGMFAPKPATGEVYLLARATTEDGEEFRLTGREVVDASEPLPENVEKRFPSYRWRKYLNRIVFFKREKRQREFGRLARFLCADANRGRPEGQRIVQIDFVAPFKRNLSDYRNERRTIRIGTWECKFG